MILTKDAYDIGSCSTGPCRPSHFVDGVGGPAGTGFDKETRVKRLIYRSMYRGCKETDFLFGKLLGLRPETFSDEQLRLYEALLDSSDPDVYAWLTGAVPFPEMFGKDFPALILSVTAGEAVSSSG